MKKILLLFVICASAVSVSSAQYYQGNILGVRAGMNATSLSWGEEFPSNVDRPAKIGWHAGFSYQRLLGQRLPFYLETGAYLSSKGGKWELSEMQEGIRHEESNTINATYLQIPLRINYHIHVDEFTIEPFVGFHYALGLWGRSIFKETIDGHSTKDKEKLYKDENDMRRSDVGIALGVGATWSGFYAGVSWDRGFLDMSKNEGKMRNSSNFMVTLGYNF